jgi:pimeloyl-ACP methyl ester carboxylesterase
MTPAFSHSTSSGVQRLHYVEGPANGSTLLLLHGVTRCWRDWELLLPELTKEWHVIALDHRGHGESDHVPDGYRVIDYARHVAEFVRAESAAPIVVLGHSLGAMVALHLAAECPELIAGAALEDPPFHTMGRHIGTTPYRAQFAGMEQVARCGGDVEALTDGLAGIRLPGPQGEVRLGDIRDRASLRFSAECLLELDPEIFTPLVAGRWLDGFDHTALWSRVKRPLLLLQGDARHGGALADDDADLAESSAPQCRRVRFDGVGHQIHRTNPAHFTAVLRQWARDAGLSNY